MQNKLKNAAAAVDAAVNTLYETVKDIVNSNGGFIDTQVVKSDGHLRDRIYGYTYRGDVLCEEYVYGIRVVDDELQVLTVPVSDTFHIAMSPEDFTSEDAEWTPLRNSDIIMTPTLQSVAESILQYIGEDKPYGFCLVPKKDADEGVCCLLFDAGYMSFYLFKTEKDATGYLHGKHLPENLIDVVPVEKGDVEEPTFIDHEGNRIN